MVWWAEQHRQRMKNTHTHLTSHWEREREREREAGTCSYVTSATAFNIWENEFKSNMKTKKQQQQQKFAYLSTLHHAHKCTHVVSLGDVVFLSITQWMQSLSRCHIFFIITIFFSCRCCCFFYSFIWTRKTQRMKTGRGEGERKTDKRKWFSFYIIFNAITIWLNTMTFHSKCGNYAHVFHWSTEKLKIAEQSEKPNNAKKRLKQIFYSFLLKFPSVFFFSNQFSFHPGVDSENNLFLGWYLYKSNLYLAIIWNANAFFV